MSLENISDGKRFLLGLAAAAGMYVSAYGYFSDEPYLTFTGLDLVVTSLYNSKQDKNAKTRSRFT